MVEEECLMAKLSLLAFDIERMNDKGYIKEFIRELAKHSGNAINWTYFLEDIIYELTEDFDWTNTK